MARRGKQAPDPHDRRNGQEPQQEHGGQGGSGKASLEARKCRDAKGEIHRHPQSYMEDDLSPWGVEKVHRQPHALGLPTILEVRDNSECLAEEPGVPRR
ncbi:hypothetical protein QMO56_03505 [Roseomonas sp. E05]|uniref:hypothetical protein n=1 Tax=Roseomonas sp. E05 TaxID=3046310 RepID=UPI0024B9EE61|nr:hypothetical protein [Roseomonas sp. E05]MDJ0387171.1 hypothetical protein [Roseomonas sp. E05]